MLREKHRSAQRRYRERLRAKHEEADQRVELLTRELNQLKAAQVPFIALRCERNSLSVIICEEADQRVELLTLCSRASSTS